jgi:hypothetical protein
MFRLRSGAIPDRRDAVRPDASNVNAAEGQPLRQFIDAEARRLAARECRPAGRSDDATFLRRVHLDLVGTLPTADEARASSRTPTGRRRKLIDKLLGDPRFATHQTNVWDQVLFGRHPAGGMRRAAAMHSRRARGAVREERPLRPLVRSFGGGASGDGDVLPQYRNQPEEATVGVSRVFLGTQLQCARCHDHPYERGRARLLRHGRLLRTPRRC